MWPFTRKGEAPTERAPAIPVPVMRQEWRQLPAMQRTIGEHPLTAPVDAFAGDLATHHDPSVVSHELGHHVGSEGPPGLVLAVARPTIRQDGPAMTPRPRLQRRVAPASQDDDEASQVDVDSSPPAGAITPAPAWQLPVVARATESPRLTRIAPDAAPMPVGPGHVVHTPLSQVQPSTASEPEVHETMAMPAHDAMAAALNASPRLTLGQSRRMGLGAPLRQVPATSLQRATSGDAELPLASRNEPGRTDASSDVVTGRPVAVNAAAAADSHRTTVSRLDDGSTTDLAGSTPTAPAARPTLPLAPSGPSQVPGSDERQDSNQPLSAPFAAIERVAAPGIYQAVTPTRELPLVQRPAPASRADDSSAATHASAATSRADSASAAASRAVGSNSSTIAEPRSATPGPPSGLALPASITGIRTMNATQPPSITAELPPSLTPAHASLAWAATVPGGATASTARAIARREHTVPLVGSRPIQSLTPLQRATDAPAASTSTIRAQARSWPVSSAPAVAGLENGPAVERTAGMFVPAMAANQSRIDIVPGAPEAIEAGDWVTPESGHVVQRPDPRSAGPDAAWRPALAAPALQRAAMTGSPAPLPLAAVPSLAVVQRATAMAESASLAASQPVLFTQRAAIVDEPEGSGSVEPADGRPRSGASASMAPATAGPSRQEEDMDALAAKLYDRIRARLKSELLVDRERAGLLTDLR